MKRERRGAWVCQHKGSDVDDVTAGGMKRSAMLRWIEE